MISASAPLPLSSLLFVLPLQSIFGFYSHPNPLQKAWNYFVLCCHFTFQSLHFMSIFTEPVLLLKLEIFEVEVHLWYLSQQRGDPSHLCSLLALPRMVLAGGGAGLGSQQHPGVVPAVLQPSSPSWTEGSSSLVQEGSCSNHCCLLQVSAQSSGLV